MLDRTLSPQETTDLCRATGYDRTRSLSNIWPGEGILGQLDIQSLDILNGDTIRVDDTANMADDVRLTL